MPGTPPSIAPSSIASASSRETAAARPWGVWATVGFSLAIALAGITAQSIAVVGVVVAEVIRFEKVPEAETIETSGLVLALATWFSAPVVVSGCVLVAWLRKSIRLTDYLAWRWPARKAALASVGALAVLIVTSDTLTLSLGRPIVPEVMLDFYKTAGFLPLLWAALIVFAPVAEEVLFRGFLFAGLERSRLGGWGAILITSLAWAVIHLQYDLYGMANIFVSGVLIGYIRWKTNSLPLCIALHALMNAISTVQTELVLLAAAWSPIS